MSTRKFSWSSPGPAIGLVLCLASIGCDAPPPIQTYRVPTKIPAELQAEKDRMLAAMVPSGDQVWFFKVTGPESAIDIVDETFRSFVEDIEITDGAPDLTELPDGWRIGADKPMRFKTIDVDTPGKQLDISVSQLARQDNYDSFVEMNVNRWRNQLSLDPSPDKWADAEPMEVAAADGPSVWVDLIGSGGGSGSMTPPFAGGTSMTRPPMMTPPATESSSQTPPATANASPPARETPIEFELPEGWRPGSEGVMRWAAFNVGPEDAEAEITIIPAGGDMKDNVARWLGQVREGGAADEVVQEAMDNAQKIEVDGREGQRFFLSGDDAEAGTAIDATIVPLEGGTSLFIKMTGPAPTVLAESEAIKAFVKSLKLK